MNNSIIIPCYNEASRIDSKAFIDFTKSNKDYSLCFVNDGSSDNTLDVLNEMKEECQERIYILDMVKNGGKAEAVRQGVQFITSQTQAESVGFIDADLSTSFKDYKSLVNRMNDAEQNKYLVFGSRKAGDQQGIDRSLLRSLASMIIGFMIQMIIKLPIRDTQCGAKVFSADIAKYAFQSPFITRWLFDVEIFLRLRMKFGQTIMKRILEVPLTEWVEVEGSHITLMDSLKMPSQLLKIFVNYIVDPTLARIPKKIEYASFRLRTALNLF